MSYQGGQAYMPVHTVDEVAEYTDMMGSESIKNNAGMSASWKNDPTKSLVMLWGVALALYWIVGTYFRRYNV